MHPPETDHPSALGTRRRKSFIEDALEQRKRKREWSVTMSNETVQAVVPAGRSIKGSLRKHASHRLKPSFSGERSKHGHNREMHPHVETWSFAFALPETAIAGDGTIRAVLLCQTVGSSCGLVNPDDTRTDRVSALLPQRRARMKQLQPSALPQGCLRAGRWLLHVASVV